MASTKENVIEMFTTLVFTVSCQHSAMNFGQYKYLGYPLNAPMSIYVDPTYIKKGEYPSEKSIMEQIMPSQHQIIKQISIAYILAGMLFTFILNFYYFLILIFFGIFLDFFLMFWFLLIIFVQRMATTKSTCCRSPDGTTKNILQTRHTKQLSIHFCNN